MDSILGGILWFNATDTYQSKFILNHTNLGKFLFKIGDKAREELWMDSRNSRGTVQKLLEVYGEKYCVELHQEPNDKNCRLDDLVSASSRCRIRRVSKKALTYFAQSDISLRVAQNGSGRGISIAKEGKP